MICDGMDIDGRPCTYEARTTRSETVSEQGERNTYVYNLCSACAHDFDESLGNAAAEAKYADEQY